jgi:xylulose-5-phosphate/fructose-6-phosphate phosphoketolase
MDDCEIISLFRWELSLVSGRSVLTKHSGYGYQVCIVEDLHRLDYELAAALQWAVGEIRTIQTAARSGKPIVKPRWPMIVLRTPKVRSPPVCNRLLYLTC